MSSRAARARGQEDDQLIATPNFIVIGAAKAGTTALYWYLREHPDVFMTPLKETNFFAYGRDANGELLYGNPELHKFPVTSEADYLAQFAGVTSERAVGEASPIYLECPQAAARINSLLPAARIICGLREPVDRAYSDYLMYLRHRGQAFSQQRDLDPGASWLQVDSHWMQLGFYHKQLTRYFELFPRNNIHIFLYDDLKASEQVTVRGIYEFLCVDGSFVPDYATPHNVGGVPERMWLERLLMNSRLRRLAEPIVSRRAASWVRGLRTKNLHRPPPLPPDLRNQMAAHFHDDIARTEHLIGRDLSAWH